MFYDLLSLSPPASILLRRGVEVPLEDKALGRELQVAWGVLERRLAEAKDFVETQTPVKAQGLQASITVSVCVSVCVCVCVCLCVCVCVCVWHL